MNAELKTALDLIDQYFRREFEHGADPEDFKDPARIGIAYTTTEEEEIPVQAYCDLVNFRIYTCLNVKETVIREEKYESLQEMIELALPYLDFAELTAVDASEMEKLNDTLEDACRRSKAAAEETADRSTPIFER